MAWRTGHGTGKGSPRIEVLPVDELPMGVAAPEPDRAPMPRPPYAAGSAEAREAGRRGGRKKAGTTTLANRLGLSKAFDDERFEPYRRHATAFAKQQLRELAEVVGGGRCGAAVGSIVMSASLQLAASRFCFEVLSDPLAASKLADSSRQNLMASWELAAKEAQARGRRKVNPLHAQILGAGSEGES